MFQLTVVATARHDNHGENFLYRMQHFVDGFIEQCKRHDLSAELIIVEWNPPDETQPLYQALKFPEDKGPCTVRFIRVPKEVHAKFQHSDKLPLFQMIAKNVGIRRAQGKFILATNIDIIFSDRLICYLRDKLSKNRLYRVDRLDVPSQLPHTSLKEILDFCHQNYFRINGKYGTRVKIDGKWSKKKNDLNFNCPNIARLKKISKQTPLKALKFILSRAHPLFQAGLFLAKKNFKKIYQRLFHKVHTNACGDFTLLSATDWSKLQGYPELEMYSWHIDSVLLYQAKQAKIKEVDLPRSYPIYHIEHSLGSGYTHETSHALFDRLTKKGIPHLTDSDLNQISIQARNQKTPLRFNSENWGLAHLNLEEVKL